MEAFFHFLRTLRWGSMLPTGTVPPASPCTSKVGRLSSTHGGSALLCAIRSVVSDKFTGRYCLTCGADENGGREGRAGCGARNAVLSNSGERERGKERKIKRRREKRG